MIRKSIFFAAIASMALATSCSQDELRTSSLSNSEVKFNTSIDSRAVETTISNLGEFYVNAFISDQTNYMKDVKYTSNDGSNWTTTQGTFYWPTGKDLNFYCYAPKVPGKQGTFTLDKGAQTLTDFSPNDAAADQKDFVYAKATGNATDNGATGVDLIFNHALSEITISAKNGNPAYTVEVTGVKIGNVKSKGTFTFPSVDGATEASWALSQEADDIATYTTTWTEAATLNGNASRMSDSNVAFMILPQQLEKDADVASNKNYLALKVKITSGSYVVHNGWVYVGINTKWEMGYRYDYTLDFTEGAGQKEDGTLVISGKEIAYNVSVTEFKRPD